MFNTRSHIAFLFTLLCCSSAYAQSSSDVVYVEEDWEMVVKTTDTNSTSPQVVATISPDAGTCCKHAVFLLNHRQYPAFAPGGFQLQLWHGDDDIGDDSGDSEQPLQHQQETVKWTTVMWLADGKIHFRIKNGSSQSWGNFANLNVSATTHHHHLNKYSPAVSVKKSGVSFGGKRVRSLKITKVRYTRANGQTTTDSTAKSVHDNP